MDERCSLDGIILVGLALAAGRVYTFVTRLGIAIESGKPVGLHEGICADRSEVQERGLVDPERQALACLSPSRLAGCDGVVSLPRGAISGWRARHHWTSWPQVVHRVTSLEGRCRTTCGDVACMCE